MSLDKPSAYLRSTVVRSAPVRVDMDARVINGYAVVTSGEALGHELWLDQEFIESVAEAGNASEHGIKSRFTHPDLSGDGLGKALGRTRDFVVDGNRVLANLHMLKAASKSPSGDLAGYVLDLAAEDPEAFGASIVFGRDIDAERVFISAHRIEVDDDSSIYSGTESKTRFQSPDPRNTSNLRHARLSTLRASDVVDEPAANPGGFFHAGQEIAAKAEAALSYCLGLSEEAPAEVAFGIHPDRAREFVARFMNQRGLELTGPKDTNQEAAMADNGPVLATVAELSKSYPNDPEFVVEQLNAEATVEQAEAAHAARTAAKAVDELAAANAKIEQLEAAAATPPAPKVDDVEAVANFDDGGSEPATGDFMQQARAYKREEGCSMTEAITTVSRKDPALHREWVESQHAHKPTSPGKPGAEVTK